MCTDTSIHTHKIIVISIPIVNHLKEFYISQAEVCL